MRIEDTAIPKGTSTRLQHGKVSRTRCTISQTPEELGGNTRLPFDQT